MTPHRPNGRVRIVGGSLRNSRLEVANALSLRPTPERVRETLFNWLAPVIAGARCLDLFAGSGALGIEALSRGAASALLVERDPRVAASLRASLQRLRLDTAELRVTDAQDLLAAPPAAPFDLVFLDPPFAAGLWTPVAAALESGGWLAPQAWIYLENPRESAPRLPTNWSPHRQAHAGEVAFALYRRGSDSLS